MPQTTTYTIDEWWNSLVHGGLLISASVLHERFGDADIALPRHIEARLRRLIDRVVAGGALDEDVMPQLLSLVLVDVLGLESSRLTAGSNIDREYSVKLRTGETWKPARVYSSTHGAELLVFNVARDAQRLGRGRGRRPVARTLEYLRTTGRQIALITTGREWRLIAAGSDHDAWCQWDVAQWFEEGRPAAQLAALTQLLAHHRLLPDTDGAAIPLVAAITESRTRQAELSTELGERVRQAVELLITSRADDVSRLVDDGQVERRDVYLAATRVVMRMVILLFAESRSLLPRDNATYADSYGIEALRNRLDRDQHSPRLARTHTAWPRLLSLFRLVYEGSTHEALPVTTYGGTLFQPGSPSSSDAIDRALHLFELPTADCSPADQVVQQMLQLLTRSRVRIRSGRTTRWITAPVDFSSLSTEYIGMLYQGLLDYELRRADAAMVFLGIGHQPVLELERLEQMNDDELTKLVKNLEKEAKAPASSDGAPEQEADDPHAADDEYDEPEVEPISVDAEVEDDAHVRLRDRARAQAERIVVVGRLHRPIRARTPAAIARDQAKRERTIERVAQRVLGDGEWFLVRWGGSRKGSGTYYTPPSLSVPTTRHTLEPLCYSDAPDGQRVPRTPTEILQLTVCDPAMGSGSFLVAALRYLTDALAASLHHHQRLSEAGEATTIRLADAEAAERLEDDSLPARLDADEFDQLLAARLKRYVVERCIHGVDLDPLAVELARLALWIETMDPTLPFTFVDHKLRCGDALVGAWIDEFRDYPAHAWLRKGGDEEHKTFVHHKHDVTASTGRNRGQTKTRPDVWGHALKTFREETVKPDLERYLTRLVSGQGDLDDVDALDSPPEDLHEAAAAAMRRLHEVPVHQVGERARIWREELAGSAALGELREAMDLWCATWFWPPTELKHAPLPSTFLLPADKTRRIAREIAQRMRFFHWELEFPDVFTGEGSGFSAVLGNPPWDIAKPSSQEFFTNHDPIYRRYGKTEALAKQREYFTASEGLEQEWVTYQAQFRWRSHYVSACAHPFDTGEDNPGVPLLGSNKNSRALTARWREHRSTRPALVDRTHPYRAQGSADINLYKLFLERAWSITSHRGRIGMIVPSGLYSDAGTKALREMFLDQASWEWLFGFENRRKIFDIHRSFKFCPIIIDRAGVTDAIRAVFMRRDTADWEQPEEHVFAYPAERVRRFSPSSASLLEIRNDRELELLEKLYDNGVPLGDTSPGGWGVTYAREFDMTNDSALFPPREAWEVEGYIADEYGNWIRGPWKPWSGSTNPLDRDEGTLLSRDGTRIIAAEDVASDEDIAVPLIQGTMIQPLSALGKIHVSGVGAGADWENAPLGVPATPLYLMSLQNWNAERERRGLVGERVSMRVQGRATDTRTSIAALIRSAGCGHSLSILRSAHAASLAAVVASLPLEWVLRRTLAGSNMTWNVLAILPLVAFDRREPWWGEAARALSARTEAAAALAAVGFIDDEAERRALRVQLDAAVARSWGLDAADLELMIGDCQFPADQLRALDKEGVLNPVGMWRVDRDLPPSDRYPNLVANAMRNQESPIIPSCTPRQVAHVANCKSLLGDDWIQSSASPDDQVADTLFEGDAF